MSYDFQKILYNVEKNGIARITLNDPERMNPLGWPMLDELASALKIAEKDKNIKVVIIKGAGRCFSTGYDLSTNTDIYGGAPKRIKEYGNGVWNSRASVQGHIAYWLQIWDLWKPVIAQVHGYCIAGASELACACDLMVIDDNCRFGYPPMRFMSSGDASALYCWHAGLKIAKEMAFGRVLSGKECVQYGFANYSCPVERLEEETTKLAERIANIHPELLSLSKRMINKTYEIMGYKTSVETCGEYDSLSHMGQDYGYWKTTEELGIRDGVKKLNEPWGGV